MSNTDSDETLEMVPNSNTSNSGLLEIEEGIKKEEIAVEESTNCLIKALASVPNALSSFYAKNQNVVKKVFCGILIIAYIIYLAFAIKHNASEAKIIIIISAMVLLIVLLEFFLPKLKTKCQTRHTEDNVKVEKKKNNESARKRNMAIRVIGILLFVAASLYIVIDIFIRNPTQIVSLIGLLTIIVVCVMTSKYPNHISWRPVIWGIAMQFILGGLVLRTWFGYSAIKFIGKEVAVFMTYSDHGSKFVFGKDAYMIHLFAFKVLPMIIFFSTVMNMLYYIGIMQWFIGKLAWITQVTLGTSAIESTVAVANIFVGMTEAPLVVRPYLEDLTNAEIHSMLTCGLGSIAFSVYGAFVDFKIDSVHLLTSCVMSAPAGLVVSRLLYPERKESKFLTVESLKMSGRPEKNIVEAAAAGASMSIGLVANIAANLIAFLALLAFINATLSWFGSFVGHDQVSFQMLCGYLFMPLAFIMGADWEDCALVGEFFGIKTFLNEFIAYKTMSPYVQNRLDGGPKFVNGTQMYISERSEMIAIHALCGFCNVSSLGIIIGGLSVLMPSRQTDLARLAVRALIGGALTCCMTASIAGLLYIEKAATIVDVNTLDTTAAMVLANTTLV